jgi:nicotinate-nucleotide adenylyltransferase
MIGIYGGSFDPVHLGHLKTATSLKTELHLDHLFLLPCCEPVHKVGLKYSSNDRLKMLNLAIDNFSTLEIDSREISRGGGSYMIDTLRELKRIYKDEPICLIIGMDSYLKIKTWKDWQEFSKLVHMVILQRQGFDLIDSSLGSFQTTKEVQQLKLESNGLLYFSNCPKINISSSDIRSRIAANQNLNDLLPKSVISYLRLHES